MIFMTGFVIALVFAAAVILGSLLWSEFRRVRPPSSVKEQVRQQTRREIAAELRGLGWTDAANEIERDPVARR